MYSRFRQLICLSLAISLFACGSSAPDPKAHLEEVVEGTASKSHGDSKWQTAAAGATFIDGDTLRTSSDGVARLRIANEILRVGNDTTVHFGAQKIGFEGDIEIGKGGGKLGIDFGDATITSTGRLRIVRRDQVMRFVVLSGSATIERNDDTETLTAGQDLKLTIENGRLESAEPISIDAGLPIAPPASPDAGVVPEVATTISAQVKGRGVRSKTDDGSWSTLRNGEHSFTERTEIEIKRRSKLTITRGQERVTLRGPGQAIVDPSTTDFVQIKRGKVDAHAEKNGLSVVVPGGSIQLIHGPIATNTEISVDSKGTSANVLSGKIKVRAGKDNVSVSLGESVRLQRGRIEVIDQAPGSSDITLGSESRSNLHVLTLPTNVRIRFKKHCERAVVEVAQGRSFRKNSQRRSGEGSATLSLGRGSHKYQVRCYQDGVLQKKPAATGSVTIRKDSGSRPLPKKAPSNRIDADGRRYTIVYQNRLPSITVAWRDAPTGSSYKLSVIANGKRRPPITASKPVHSFKSGQLGEGDYEYWFGTQGKESKHSRLKVSFDNAASTGYLSAPAANKEITPGTVQVKGAAVLGWSVFVGPKRLSLDRQHRFDEQVKVGSDGLAVRFSHPKYGNHYYLRGRK